MQRLELSGIGAYQQTKHFAALLALIAASRPKELSLELSNLTDDEVARLVGAHGAVEQLELRCVRGVRGTVLGSRVVARLRSLTIHPYCDWFRAGTPIRLDRNAAFLGKGSRLTRLTLSGVVLTDKLARSIARIRTLRAVDVTMVDGLERMASALRAHRGVERFSSERSKLSDATCAALAQSPSLRELTLSLGSASKTCVKRLGSLKTLQTLQLLEYRLTNAVCRELGALEGVRDLVLASDPFPDACLRSVRSLTSLRRLVLRGTKINPQLVAPLRRELKALEKLEIE